MLFTPPRAKPIEIEPLISIQLFGHKPAYPPGALLRCDYQIDAVRGDALQAVEASVLWYTEGKGDEDMGVHYFERRVPSDAPENDLRQLRSFAVTLPNSPLSYEGEILQIRWCVRVRAFMKGGKEYREDYGFDLAGLVDQPVVDKGRRAPGVLCDAEDRFKDAKPSRTVTAHDSKNQSCEA